MFKIIEYEEVYINIVSNIFDFSWEIGSSTCLRISINDNINTFKNHVIL